MDASGISSVLGLRGVGIKLRRGFAPSESPQPTQVQIFTLKRVSMADVPIAYAKLGVTFVARTN